MAASQSALTNKCPVCKDDTRLHLLACSNRYCVERDGTRCEGCSRSKIEACCTICLKLLCFRCGVVQKECKTSNKKHDIEPIEEVLEEGQTRVKQWIESTNIKVHSMKSRHILRREFSAVEEQITPIEQTIKCQQHILDKDSSVLDAANAIFSINDPAKIIRLSEQICD